MYKLMRPQSEHYNSNAHIFKHFGGLMGAVSKFVGECVFFLAKVWRLSILICFSSGGNRGFDVEKGGRMNLVKWMRKNNRQIMAVVVVLIMIGFVGGYGLQQLLTRGGSGGVAGYYSGEKRITWRDITEANTELRVLRSLFAAEMLRYRQTIFQTPDFKSRLLGQLLFPDSESAAATSVEMYQAMAQGQLDVTGKEIDAFFEPTRGRSEVYWILLRTEARRAGCVVNSSQAKQVLQAMIPQIVPSRGMPAGQLVSQVLENAIRGYHMPEEQVLRLFGDLLGVMMYADAVTSNESVTTNELRALTGRSGERLSGEIVKFAAADFVADVNTPAEDVLAAQFEKYKDVVEGEVTEENPHGFGYKLPARVQLDYLLVRNEDVRPVVEQPTLDEMESYYARNISRFQEEIESEQDDPEGQKKTRPKPYAEVADDIREMLIDERTERLVNVIVSDAMELAEAGFADLDTEKATAADLKAKAVSFEEVAAKLKERHKVQVHAGRTGLLSMSRLSNDSHLGTMSMEGPSRVPVGLAKMVFAIDELQVTALGPFETRKPRMWENLGPLQDRFGASMAVVRVTDAVPAETPANMDVSYSTQGAVVNAADERRDAVHSVREEVIADCKLLAAMETAKARAEEFAAMLSEKSWTEAVDAYNEKYQKKTDDGKPLPFGQLRSETLSNQTRTSDQDIEQMRQRYADLPMAASFIQRTVESKRLTDRLFALLGDDRKEAKDLNVAVEFKPGSSYYVVKDLSLTPANEADYAESKALRAFSMTAARSQSLALVHYKPDNIMKRMSFRWAESEDRDAAEQAEAAETQEASI
jgi:hypothetical protein